MMLNGLVERGAIKCHQYWPHNSAQPFSEAVQEQLTDVVRLKVELLSEVNKEHFIIRTCRLTDLEVCVYRFISKQIIFDFM